MSRYAATIGVPGRSPLFGKLADSPREAWQLLCDERMRSEDEAEEPGGYSVVVNILETLGTDPRYGSEADYQNAGLDPIERTGTVTAQFTPGLADDEVDHGLDYSVVEVTNGAQLHALAQGLR